MSSCRTKKRTALTALVVVLLVSFAGFQALADNPPVINGMPADFAVDNDPGVCGAVVTWTEPTAYDDNGIVSFSADAASGDTFPIGTTTVTYTAVDTIGQITTDSFDIVVTDIDPPVAQCKDATVYLDASGSYLLKVADIDNGSYDPNSCTATLTMTGTTSYTCTDIGSKFTVTLQIDDGTNTDTCTADVTVADNIAPTIINCVGDIGPLNPAAGLCYAPATWTDPVVTTDWDDNCPATCSWSYDHVSGDNYPVGITTVTATLEDSTGNSAQCTFTITVEDNEDPTITAPADVGPVSVDAGQCYATGVALGTPTVTDNCTGGLGPWYTNDAPAQFAVGTTTVTWTATDGSGNTHTDTQLVTVVDDENPTVTCPADITETAEAGKCDAVVTFTLPAGDDNCGVLSVVASPASGSVFPVGTTPVTITVTDTATPANTNTCTFNVIVTDDEDPVLTCPTDITQNNDAGLCSAVVTIPVPTGTDNCPGPYVYENDWAADWSLKPFPVGPTLVTWTMKDVAGNEDTCVQTVTIVDNEPPSISSCPAGITVDTDPGLCTASGVDIGLITPLFTDNCGAVASHDAPAIFPKGTTTVNWTVTDAAGLTDTCAVTVTVEDNEDPVITCPADITLGIDPAGSCGNAYTLIPATATDNCDPSPGITHDWPGGPFLVSGSPYTVTWTATDADGNSSSCQQIITVFDDEDPTITAPADVADVADFGVCYATGVVLGAETSNDNCPGAIVSNDAPTQFLVGDTTVTWTIIDAAGNIAKDTQLVTITDDQDPVFVSCPPNQSIPAEPGLCSAVATWADPVVTENCSLAYFDSDIASGSVFTVVGSPHTVTYTAIDASGNSVDCTFTITVYDDEQPTAVCKDFDLYLDATGNATLLPQNIDGGSSDNCMGNVILGVSKSKFTCADLGANTVTLTVDDGVTVPVTCDATVTVIDDTPPDITSWPSDKTVPNDPGRCDAVVTWLPGSAWDACGVIITYDFASGSVFPLGPTTVTMTAKDGSNNTSTRTFVITVEDQEAPVITCPADVTLGISPVGNCGNDYTLIPATAIDNCDPAPAITHDWTGGDFPIGTTTVTWTATDAAGNTASCPQLITVQDDEEPVAKCQDFTLELDITGNATLLPSDIDDGSKDNCAITVWMLSEDTFDCTDIGPHSVTLTVYDYEGNADSCVSTVTVADNRAPDFTGCPGNPLPLLAPAPGCTTTYWWTPPTVNDNCGVVADYTWSHNPGDTFSVGTTTVTYTAKDPYGNTGVCSFDVVVYEDVAPVITCPTAVTVYNDPGVCYATGVALGTATATDNCDPAPVISNNAPTQFPKGDTTVTWLALDSSGNTATCTQTVTVLDNEPPVITCPGDFTVYTDPSLCSAVVAFGTATAVDNCDPAPVITHNWTGGPFPKGDTTITWTATDADGNSSTCPQTITVIDGENPVITCPADIAVNTDPGACFATVNLGTATATDNCDVPVITNDAPATFQKGVTVVTWKAMDLSGNWMTCPQTVTVSDAEAPVITCPASVTVGLPVGSLYVDGAAVSLGAPTVTDNCAIASITNDAPGTYPPGVTTVTWTAIDTSGNVSICTQLVNIAGTPLTFTPESTFGSYLEIAAPDPEQYFNDIKLAAVIPLGDVIHGVFGLIGASFSDLVDGVRVELIEVTGTTGAEVYNHIGFVWGSYSAAEDVYRFEFQTMGIDPLVMLDTGMAAPFDLLPGAYDIFVWLELPGGRHVSSPRLRILIPP